MNDKNWQERTDTWVKAQHEERRKKEKQRLMKNRNPVKKNMDKFHKPRTHKDKTKYDRKSPSETLMDEIEPIYHPTEYDESDDIEYAKRVESMIDEGGPVHPDSKDEKTP